MRDGIVEIIGLSHKAASKRKVAQRRVCAAGGKQLPDPRPMPEGMMRQSKPVHLARHVDIGEQDADCRGLRFQMGQRFGGMPGFQDSVRARGVNFLRVLV